ncbi:MAG: hypothetical protein IIZ73_09285 [Ruminococcus sp.]|nr:hypothetical protein [Ruminococcus sp.]
MIKTLTFLGHSTAEFEGVTVASADYGTVEARRSDDEIALRDGALNGSRADGRLRYKSRTITYVLNVLAAPADIEGRLSALREWLSSGCGDLTDGFNTGWKFTNADFLSAKVDYIDMFRGAAQMTVRFTADPYMQSITGTRQRLTKWTADGNTARAVIDNHTVHSLVWLITPTIADNAVSFTVTAEMAQSSARDFCLFGLTAGAEVESAVVVREQTPITGGVTMTAADRGALGAVQAGDVVYIYYTDDVTAAAIGCPTTTGTVYSIQSPKYRLEALTEGTPVLRINGAVQSILQAFTLPDTALLTVETSGYGYYELWHDNTEVRL